MEVTLPSDDGPEVSAHTGLEYPYRFYATIPTGFEYNGAREIKERLGVDCHFDRRRFPGRVVFSLPSMDDDTYRRLQSLRSLEHVSALVGTCPTPPEMVEEQWGAIPGNNFTDEEWTNALLSWKTYMRMTKGIKNKEFLECPIFSTTCRVPSKSVSHKRIASDMNNSIKKRFPRWVITSRDPSLEIFVDGRFGLIYLTIAITSESVSMNQLSKERNLGATPLRPAIAFSLISLANIQPGEIVIDPLCGCGTIPEIVSDMFPECFVMGGDIAPPAIEKSLENFSMHRRNKDKFNIDLVKWDSCKLPLPNASVNVIITDLPFGKRMGTHKSNRDLYPKFLAEFQRILHPAGRLVLLTLEKELLYRSIKNIPNLKLEKLHSINQGGMPTYVFLLHLKKQKIKLKKGDQVENSKKRDRETEQQENLKKSKESKTEIETNQ
eukprot:TRINITY_DN488_c0_g2_i1.p1 TRINITY_DN488_c0_g2~~TRINITY_DN488_c0_g2_i1.p1  ORF type:complete len:436 (-),score=119.71 TRINITY_DN488_c0_g2_i1:15-1322(-)